MRGLSWLSWGTPLGGTTQHPVPLACESQLVRNDNDLCDTNLLAATGV